MKKLILAIMSISLFVSGSLTINANTDDNYTSSSDLNLQLDYLGTNPIIAGKWEANQGNTGLDGRGWYRDNDKLILDYHQGHQNLYDIMPAGRYEFSTHAGARYSHISLFGILIDINAEILTFDISYPQQDAVLLDWVYQPSQIPYTNSGSVGIYGIDDQGSQIVLYDNNMAGSSSVEDAYARGETYGYNNGYAEGDTTGYLRGYNAGFNQGSTQAQGLDQLTTNMSNGLGDILSLEIGGISLGALALIPISISMFLWFMKISRR